MAQKSVDPVETGSGVLCYQDKRRLFFYFSDFLPNRVMGVHRKFVRGGELKTNRDKLETIIQFFIELLLLSIYSSNLIP